MVHNNKNLNLKSESDQTIRRWDCNTCQQIQVFYAASGIWTWHPTESDLLAAGDAVGYLYFLKIHNREKRKCCGGIKAKSRRQHTVLTFLATSKWVVTYSNAH